MKTIYKSDSEALKQPPLKQYADGYHAWCMTYFPDGQEGAINYVNKRLLDPTFRQHCQFAIFGFELTSYDRLHLQCYVFMKEKRSVFTMRRLFPDCGYLFPAIESPERNYNYCSKQGNFIYYGYIPSAQDQWELLKKLDFDSCLI